MNFLKGSLFRRNTEPEELEPERPQPASSAVIIHRHSSMAAPRFHRFIGLPPGIDFSSLYMLLRQK